MAKQPQGLSPNFNSIVSPQIVQSQIFSWTFIKEKSSDYQKSAEVKVYNEGSNTALFTVTGITDDAVDVSSYLTALDLEQSYEWEVKVTSSDNTTALSGKKTFKYVSVFQNGDLSWPDGPDPYEYIGTRQYFEEIKSNALQILEDYEMDSQEEFSAFVNASKLFTGDIVPSRADFNNLHKVLGTIASKESTIRADVQKWIEDGLGAEDIHKIYTLFDSLVRIPPKRPENVSMTFTGLSPLIIEDGSVYNKNEADLSVDVAWTPTALDTGNGIIRFTPELTEDISYYEIELRAGFTDVKCRHLLYYRLEDINDENRRLFVPMEHIYFEHLSSSKKTRYELNIVAVDKRDHRSVPYYLLYDVKDVPLGVSSYKLRAQQNDLQDKKVIKAYYDIYNGPAKAYVHNVKGNVDGVYHYAVQLTDKNGNVSPWFYIPDEVKIDPLKPPAAPKPKVKSADTDSIVFSWDYVKDADKYEIDPQFGTASNSVITSNSKEITGLKENTNYAVKIRATNRAGSSAWVSISGKTKAKPIVEYIQKKPKTRTWRTSYYIHLQSGREIYPIAEYMPEKDNVEVMHGQWIELRDKYESGMYVRKGTRWGNHKSLFFLDYSGWQNRLKGKEIVEVKFYIKRRSTEHGYPQDGRFLNVYSHNYAGTSNLPKASDGPSLGDHYKVDKLDFNRGEGHWVTLPKSFGEKLRDGKIKGIGFHHPTSTNSPYSYMRFDATTFEFKIRYK